MERRDWLSRFLACTSVGLLPGLSACDSDSLGANKLTIAHAYQPSFGLLYVAEKAGFFKEEGIDVEFKRYGYGREALQATLEGKADIATPSDIAVALAIVKKEPVRVLSSLSVMLGNAQVLGNKNRGIHTPADLKGRRIGFIPNTNGDYSLSLVLANAGIDEQQVTRLSLQNPDELAHSFIRGDVDAVALWAPYTHAIASEMGADVVIRFTSAIYVETALLTTTENTLRTKKNAIKKLMSALIKAQNLTMQDPSRALQHVKNALPDTPPDVVASIWSSMQPQIHLENRLLECMTNEISWFQQKMHLEQVNAPDVRVNIAHEILRSIAPQTVTIKERQ